MELKDWLMICLTGVYVIATIAICFFNYRSAKASQGQIAEMKRQYDEENRAYITVEVIFEKKSFYGLRFSNHGKRIANKVEIQFDQKFIDSIKEANFKNMIEKEKDSECVIGIGNHHDLYFGTQISRENPDKSPITGTISYSDGKGNYTDSFSIDFYKYMTIYSVNSYEEDFLEEMKKIRSALEKKRIV